MLPLILLFHLTDFAEPLPRARRRGLRAQIYTLSHLAAATKVARCQAMVNLVRQHYRVETTRCVLDQYTKHLQRTPPLTLAISTTHETGAALFEGDRLLAAINEERLDRVKGSTRYPPRKSIKEVLQIAKVDPREIQDIIISGLPPGRLLQCSVRRQCRDLMEFHGWIDYVPHFCRVLYRVFAFARALRYRSVV
ncbi:hypothetical protein C2W62_35085 [Candidatus Entotheonella serta]|nr:hypothetical protein C2W62_35085 [Candidatus Entotheonella serta]